MTRVCLYCWAEYWETKPWRSPFCSPECRSRSTSWDRWIADSRHAAVHGNINEPTHPKTLPIAGRTLTRAVERFQSQLELPTAEASTGAAQVRPCDRFYVRRTREDGSISFVGPLPPRRAVAELGAWLSSGVDADLVDVHSARDELKRWERTIRTGERYYPERRAA